MARCTVCGSKLEELGLPKWKDVFEDWAVTDFVAIRTVVCNNKNCPLYGKEQNVRYEFYKIEVGDEEFDIYELMDLEKEYKKKSSVAGG